MDTLKKLLSEIALATKIKVRLEMHDYENWKDGIYHGDAGKYAPVIIDILNEYYHFQPELDKCEGDSNGLSCEQLQGFFEFYKEKFGGGFNTDVLEITLKQYRETL